MTRLVMPRAGTDPGPAARAVPQPANEVGAAIGELGQVANNIGTAIINDKLDREMRRAQVDLTRDINNLRLEIEQVGDPDEAEQQWSQGISALRQSYVAPGDNGQWRVSPRNLERFNLAFDDLANRHAYQIGAQSIERRQSERMATYRAYQFEAERAATKTDADTRDVLAVAGEEQIAGLLNAGIIDAEQAEIERQTLRQNLDRTAAFETYNSDPELFLEELDRGDYEFLDPQVATRMKAGAKADLLKAEEKAQKTAEAKQSERQKAVANDLGRISSISDTTRLTATDRAFVESAEVAELAKSDDDVALALRKAQARISLDQDAQVYETMTPAELRTSIEIERQRKVKHPFEEERLGVLEQLLDQTEKSLDTDPLGHVASLGFEPPALDLDADPETLEAQLAARVRHGRVVQERGFTDGIVILRPEEREQLKEALGKSANVARREAVLQSFARELGDDAQLVIAAATNDPAQAHIAHLITQGAPASTTRDALLGQKRLADKTVSAPSPDEFRAAFRGATGNMFLEYPDLEKRLIATATALYANADIDAGTVDSDIVRQSVNRALGGDGQGRGGIAYIDRAGLGNAYNLPLPANVAAREVTGALDLIERGLQEYNYKTRTTRAEDGAVVREYARKSADFTALKAASLNGTAPNLGDENAAEIFEDLQIVPVWKDGQPRDAYTFVRMTPRGPVAIMDENGDRYEFSLNRLVRASRQ
ncbi:hypothetical protein [Roseovarius atlanticus]|uniref:hypothetical protein n=1 Tax=Roseovarius atlanticus TaxID=1641875 RepID=UPI001C94B750|nr:hypothetical protein [Roseovarius atlanticus]MBY5988217.1 hypothetical protein [Roseovarius atlanticus]MBY6123608.1 hypothetical protein [Roseovarius atlanticus]MBY6148103.1 hypothetical protein [Roseovarius atlanticus]